MKWFLALVLGFVLFGWFFPLALGLSVLIAPAGCDKTFKV